MIALDTNILVYAHRGDSAWHDPAARCLTNLAEGPHAWAIPWPCVHEFFAKATHPRIFTPPSSPSRALGFIEALAASPTVVFLGEGDGYLERLGEVVRSSHVTGAMVHDARIAALCLQHGVSELWTADRDFGRFAGLKTHNPLT